MPFYNKQPHPRIVFEGIPDEIYDQLEPLAGSSLRIEMREEFHASDFDMVVTFSENLYHLAPSLHILAFGATQLTVQKQGKSVQGTKEKRTDGFGRVHQTRANTVALADDLSPERRTLIEQSIVINVPQGIKNTWTTRLGPHRAPMPLRKTTAKDGSIYEPFVFLGAEEYVWGARWTRKLNSSFEPEVFCTTLPSDTTHHRQWLASILRELHEIDEIRFPADPEWQQTGKWASHAGLMAKSSLDGVIRKGSQTRIELQREEGAAQEAFNEQVQRDSNGLQCLLTTDGEALEVAVADALAQLGFCVESRDEHPDEITGAKLEDLRVTEQLRPEWTCLVEIKGYSKGAKVNDVAQITGRPSTHFAAKNGRAPDAVWHVVNAWRKKDPSDREIPIPNDDDLRLLTGSGGLLIDTRQLFLALRDVQAEKVSSEEVRAMLREATGRWQFRVQAENTGD